MIWIRHLFCIAVPGLLVAGSLNASGWLATSRLIETGPSLFWLAALAFGVLIHGYCRLLISVTGTKAPGAAWKHGFYEVARNITVAIVGLAILQITRTVPLDCRVSIGIAVASSIALASTLVLQSTVAGSESPAAGAVLPSAHDESIIGWISSKLAQFWTSGIEFARLLLVLSFLALCFEPTRPLAILALTGLAVAYCNNHVRASGTDEPGSTQSELIDLHFTPLGGGFHGIQLSQKNRYWLAGMILLLAWLVLAFQVVSNDRTGPLAPDNKDASAGQQSSAEKTPASRSPSRGQTNAP